MIKSDEWSDVAIIKDIETENNLSNVSSRHKTSLIYIVLLQFYVVLHNYTLQSIQKRILNYSRNIRIFNIFTDENDLHDKYPKKLSHRLSHTDFAKSRLKSKIRNFRAYFVMRSVFSHRSYNTHIDINEKYKQKKKSEYTYTVAEACRDAYMNIP